MSGRTPPLTRAELLKLPATVDVATAGRALGIGRSAAYALVQRDEFPIKCLRVGRAYRVPTERLLHLLGLERPGAAGALSQSGGGSSPYSASPAIARPANARHSHRAGPPRPAA